MPVRSLTPLGCCRRFVSLSLLTSTLYFGSSPAHAQGSPTATLPAVTVTARRVTEPDRDVPAAVSVITAEDIARNPATTLPDLLGREAGLVVRDNAGNPDQQIDLRGFGITGDQNTLILINGQRISEIELQTAALSSIPIASIERIEIVRGAGAVLYGSGATGGVINIITRGPVRGDTSGVLTGLVGSYATRAFGASARTAGERVGLSVDANRYNSDNYRFNNRVEQENVQTEARLFLDRGHVALKLGRDAQDLRLPGPRTAGQLTSDPRGAATPGDYATRDGHRAMLSVAHDLAGGRVEADFGYRDLRRTSVLKDYSGFNFPDAFNNTTVRVLSFTPRVRLPYDALRAAHEITVGVDWTDWDVEQRRATNQAALAQPLAQVFATQRTTGVYARNVSRWMSNTTLALGLRQERVSMSARDAVNPAAYANGRMSRDPIAWEAGIRQGVARDTSVYARIGASFRYATVDEVYNPFGGPFFDSRIALLEPQTSRDHEIGAEYRSATSRLRVSAYLLDLKNEIAYFAPIFQNVNLPPTRRAGLELDGATALGRTVTVYGSVSVVEATFRDGVFNGIDVRGKTVPLVPRSTAKAGVRWRVWPATELIANARYIDKQRYDNDQGNAFPELMPAYTLVDLRVLQRIQRLTLGLGIDNVFDRRTYSYGICAQSFASGLCQVAPNANPFNGYPQRGRTFLATAEYRF